MCAAVGTVLSDLGVEFTEGDLQMRAVAAGAKGARGNRSRLVPVGRVSLRGRAAHGRGGRSRWRGGRTRERRQGGVHDCGARYQRQIPVTYELGFNIQRRFDLFLNP